MDPALEQCPNVRTHGTSTTLSYAGGQCKPELHYTACIACTALPPPTPRNQLPSNHLPFGHLPSCVSKQTCLAVQLPNSLPMPAGRMGCSTLCARGIALRPADVLAQEVGETREGAHHLRLVGQRTAIGVA